MEERDRSARPPRRSSPPKRSSAGDEDGPFLCDVEGADGTSAGKKLIWVGVARSCCSLHFFHMSELAWMPLSFSWQSQEEIHIVMLQSHLIDLPCGRAESLDHLPF